MNSQHDGVFIGHVGKIQFLDLFLDVLVLSPHGTFGEAWQIDKLKVGIIWRKYVKMDFLLADVLGLNKVKHKGIQTEYQIYSVCFLFCPVLDFSANFVKSLTPFLVGIARVKRIIIEDSILLSILLCLMQTNTERTSIERYLVYVTNKETFRTVKLNSPSKSLNKIHAL